MSNEPNIPNDGEPKQDRRGAHPNSKKNLHMWKKGQSGNPSGVSMVFHQMKVLARTHTLEAIQTLYDRMKYSRNDRVRVMAADMILDRGWGKPAQVIESEGEQLIVTVRTVSGAEPWVAPKPAEKDEPGGRVQ